MGSLIQSVERLALDPKYHDAFTVLKAARNGAVYGAKIRFPHALVMTVLFGKGSPKQKANFIFSATKQHSTNLMKFASLYKFACIMMRRRNGGKERSGDSFFAGCLAGWYVFGDRNAVNEQIVLYCVARCVSSLLPREPVPDGYPSLKAIPTEKKTFSIFAALVWGSVMWLFKNRRQSLQGGLINSMDYLYINAEKWTDLRTLLWHNS